MEQEKIQQAIAILNEPDIPADCWMVIDKESEVLTDPIMDFVIGTGVTWLSFFLFFASGEKYAIVGNLDIEKIKRTGSFDEVYGYKNSPKDDLLKILKKHNPTKIAINFSKDSPPADGLTYGRYLQLLDILEGTGYAANLISAEQIIARLRGRKSPEEIRRLKKAVEIALQIYGKVSDHVSAGMTEQQVAQFITAERQALGYEPAWEEDHCPSIFAGPQETGAHSGPTGKVLQKGEVFNADFGIKYENYCSDLQRTWYLLKDGETAPPAEVKKGIDTIIESIKRSFAALKPGVKGIEIDTIAREYIVSQGYKEYPHALGHQVGRVAHDGGALLAPAWERYGEIPYLPLEEGQVFTIEPRLYIPQGVVTIEEMVVITADGAEWLSPPQEEIYLIK